MIPSATIPPLPKLSFLLSAFDKPSNLWVSLGCLLQQSLQEWECLVLLNNHQEKMIDQHQHVVNSVGDSRIRMIYSSDQSQPQWESYWSADWAFESGLAKGEWLAFPSDDTYYCPEFAGLMVSEGELDQVDLVLCDILYDCRLTGKRDFLTTAPKVGLVDKTSFVVRRRTWKGFGLHKPQVYGQSNADGEVLEEMVNRGVKHSKVEWPLVVHN